MSSNTKVFDARSERVAFNEDFFGQPVAIDIRIQRNLT